MSFMIGMYTEGLEIGAKSLEEQSIGGSESAFIYMARELAKLGNEIKVFCKLDSKYANIRRDEYGIDWYDISELPNLELMYKFDVFLCYRFFNVFGNHNLNSNLNIIVNHDVLTDRNAYMTCAWQVDHIFNLSKYHCDIYAKELPELKDFIWKTRNGIDLDKMNSIPWPEKRENRLVYASRPERGLERLLLMWENGLKNALPDYELAICGYELGRDMWASLHPKQREYYKNLDIIANNMERVKKYGNLTKGQYFSLLKGSKAMVYPTSFPEISCINALESMGCGTPVISTDAFALSETIGDKGVLISGDPDSEEYKHNFATKLRNLLSNKNQWKEYSYRGKQWVTNGYQWKDIAKNWMDKFEELLATRFTRNKEKILDQLIYNSDIMAANKIAKEYKINEYVKKTDEIIEKTKTYKEEFNDGGYVIFENKSDYLKNPRFGSAIDFVENIKAKSVLDIGCHVGSFSISLSNILSDIKVTGVDISEECIESANALKEKFAKNKDNIEFLNWDCRNAIIIEESKYDLVFAGEILEHMIDINGFIEKLENTVKPDGYVYITVPSGPWESMSFDRSPNRFHISHFEMQDLKELFGKKKDFKIQYIPANKTNRGELVGWWLISYKKNNAESGELTYSSKIYTRPYQFVSCGLITYNEENNISKCLKSVRDIVDEIVVCDSDSTDDTLKIVEKFTDKFHRISRDPDGDGLFNFAWARNETLKLIDDKCDWFLWLDADEELIDQNRLRRYLNSPIYEGYVLTQNHLILDMKDAKPDTPVRIFKNKKGYKFYGVVHEQSMKNLNEQIHPSLTLPYTKLLHYGYTTESVRRWKCSKRNIALLIKDRKVNPDRQINLCLLMRDYFNSANWEIEAEQGVTDKAAIFLRTACDIWEQEFRYNKEHPYYGLAFPLYQQVLEKMGHHGLAVKNKGVLPLNISLSLAGAIGELSGKRYEPQVYWFKDDDEYKDWMSQKSNELVEKLNYPKNGGH